MSHPRCSLIILLCLGSIAGCGKKPAPERTPAAKPSENLPAAPSANALTPPAGKGSRTEQEYVFIRDSLAVGLRPTILLEIETKALAEVQGQTKANGPTKAQLKDLRASFSAAEERLRELATSSSAGRMAKVPQLLAEARAKQAANCSRLPDELLHGEGVGLMMLEFIKITAQAPNQQEADRRAGEHFKQNWPDLINLPLQQKAALDEILGTEREIHQLVERIDKETEFKLVQRQAIAEVYREVEARAKKTAAAMNPERFYATLLGTGFPQRPWIIEKGELVSLAIREQKIIGHCIVSKIHLEVRGRNTGQNAAFDLNVVHRTYADGRPAVLQVLER